jgi:hypothetical protein
MWSSWLKGNGTTHVMYIGKLKDGPKRVKKTFSIILERVFEKVWWRGRKWNYIEKDFWSWSIFLLSKYYLSLYLKRLLELFFLFLSFFSVSWRLGVLMKIFEEKITSSKLVFKWLQYIGGGRIFRNGVMHGNMAKPWLWRWESCRYIGGGRIFRSGLMHANIFGWG